MSNITLLHSHSGLERELHFPKHTVLVDAKFGYMFLEEETERFKYAGVEYLKVPTYSFYKKGGVFKNFPL